MFLRDVILISITAIGGPQAHIASFLERLVRRHRYISEEDLVEIQSLCTMLPGPTSTQTITAIGYKVGGLWLAYITLLVWVLPAVLIMTFAAIGVNYLGISNQNLNFSRFVQPMAISFMLVAIWNLAPSLLKTPVSYLLLAISAVVAYFFPSPYITPALILLGGVITSFDFHRLEKMPRQPFTIDWTNLIIWAAIFIGSAIVGKITHNLPLRLFENFYRNGSLTFGGGYVLKPLLYTEFVEFKHYLNSSEYLSGMALAEIIPGPVFSISSYVGGLSMRDAGLSGQLLGSLMATLGIFLPGSFFIVFAIRIWTNLKKYRGIRASITGVGAVSLGLTLASSGLLVQSGFLDIISVLIIIVSTLILKFTKLPSYLLILVGLVLGLIF